ncbi:glycosyltransferase family A protein [Nesterenkonia sp. NBAIMH1]|uniref:glycosyltransferase family 2 protein n=1 Tax=Nesterenkonia sp. NBAIMH1 TaxID=2600320 RepID=UPI00143CE429|nr:glycosyltransferase family A protein [Nesterenkonia sp. NBAIMH1]
MNPQLSVVIPVYNNGELLRTTSFPSLTASEHFDQMEILLVDDGSTYAATREAVAELAAAHTNVRAHFFDDGGSGSGGRPRNMGLDLASAPHIAFLDPDDAVLNDGLWQLGLALERHPSAQLAIGNQLRTYSDRTEHVDNLRHYTHSPRGGLLYAAGGDVLAAAKFRPTNLSSFAVRRDWLRAARIRQVHRAAGQDSLFFLQVFSAAEVFVACRTNTYEYHAEVPGSMVNALTDEYFRKCLLRERAQRTWLDDEGLLETYVRSGFERSFVWYLRQLRRTPSEQRRQAASTLTRIAELYVEDPLRHRWRYPQSMAFFRRPGVPSPEGLKPWAAAARRRAAEGSASLRDALAARRRRAGRTLPGHDR